MQSATVVAEDPLLTIRQLAEREGLTERQVRYMISRDGLPCYRAQGLRVRWSEYKDWLASRRGMRGRR